MLMELTNELQKASLRLKENFINNQQPVDQRDPSFFEIVKTETEPLFNLIERWEKESLAAIKQRELLIHPQQIKSTRENFELVLLHSYYIDVKPKRYMELQQAINYVCELIKKDFNY
ncbi:YppE family protein [Amphibacillus sp. MSJ-3]|uniref:DUF1798 family protein n=1 Tax=Amphibacillus sp. MSJ-3 TaxID=2841505 RepID=UPI001C0EB685|nr:DUF1798 family protein [Amphibacillus sp. MSJ-3]MBU5594205.1 YppE family protein [Amphibacillus sp. MSJ-3]